MYVQGVVAYVLPFQVPNQLKYVTHLMSLISLLMHVNPHKVSNVLAYVTQLDVLNVVAYAPPPKVPNRLNWYAVHLKSLMTSLMHTP